MTRAEWLSLAERVERDGASVPLYFDLRDAFGHPDADMPCGMGIFDSLDAAASAMPPNCFLATLGEIAADGLPGACICIGNDPVREVWGVARHSGPMMQKLARALLAAALRARAEGVG